MNDADREIIARYLATRDVACPVCGYDLKELTTPRCPECGLELELKLALARPRQAVYINGIVALGAGIGFSALLLAYFLWMRILGNFYPNLADIYPLGIGLIIEGPALVVWARSWSTFQRQPKALGWTLVGACWAITIATAVLFFAWID